MTGFQILNPGILTTVQDAGRIGYSSIGVTHAGAMDEFAFHWVNRLLDNSYGTNALEVLIGGLKLKSIGTACFSICGTDAEVKVNDVAINLWSTHRLEDGDTLEIGMAKNGMRLYLGVKGGFDVASEYGSHSVCIKEGIGGKPLTANSILPHHCNNLLHCNRVHHMSLPKYNDELMLRIVSGYQWNSFSKKERDKFFAGTYNVTPQNDRMGFRLSGEKITPNAEGIISEPIAYGSIQIPPHGEPIILLKERQTIGGYPKIGSVIPVDCFRLAQAKPGTKITFSLVSLDQARKINTEFYSFFKE